MLSFLTAVRKISVDVFFVAIVFSKYSVHSIPIKSNFYRWKHNWDIHYVSAGATGPPVLLVPGFGVGTFHFERNIETLAMQGFRVYSFDLLGQGLSWPQEGKFKEEDRLCYSCETWIEQTIYFIENIIGESTHIAGNSLGGYISVATSSQKPALIRSAILLNPTPFWGFNQKGECFLWDGVLPAPDPLLRFGSLYFDTLRNRNTIKTMLEGVYASNKGFGEDLIKSIIDSASKPGGQEAFTSILFAPKLDADFDDMVKSIKAPICLVMGKEDPWIVPYWGQRLKRIQPNTAYFELSPTGHCPHHESPKAVNSILSSWVSHVEGGIVCKSIVEASATISLDGVQECYEESEERCVSVSLVDGSPRNIFEKFGAFCDKLREG